jgi:hypothetical protein
MSEVITVTLDDGSVIYVEAAPTAKQAGSRPAARGRPGVDEVLADTEHTFEQVHSTIQGVARSIASAIYAADQKITPSSFTLELSIKINASGQAILASVGAEAQLKLALTYNHDQRKKPGGQQNG